MSNLIPYSRQHIDKKDILSVNKAIKSDLITTGKFVETFEKNLKKYFKSKYVSVCSSGTAAIHLALLAIGAKKNDVIILPSINFVAAENMSKLIGVKIFFADVDEKTGQVNYETLVNCVKKNKIKKIKAFFVSYIGGNIFDIQDFIKFKKRYKCFFIEDACHALGSTYELNQKKYRVGNCKHSDISTFSFHPLKSITTGEGGAISTNKKSFYNKINLLRNHGFDRKLQNKKKNKVIISKEVGFNYRMSDLNCALGISQLSRISKFIKKRNDIFRRYEYNLKNLDIVKLIKTKNRTQSSYHLVLLLINFSKIRINKNNLRMFLIKNKITTQIHYYPFFLKSKNINFKKNYNGAINYYYKTLSLPVYFKLSLKKVDYICEKLKDVISKNTKQ